MAKQTPTPRDTRKLKHLAGEVTQRVGIQSWTTSGRMAAKEARRLLPLLRQVRADLKKPENHGNIVLAQALGFHSTVQMILRGKGREKLVDEITKLAKKAPQNPDFQRGMVSGALFAMGHVSTMMTIFDNQSHRSPKAGSRSTPLPSANHMRTDAAEGANSAALV